jgi:hypothetical protein
MQSKLGKDHTDVAYPLHNLGDLYFAMGQHARAEAHYRSGLIIRRAQLLQDHPDVATSLAGLTAVHAAQERWSEAAREATQVRRIVRKQVDGTLPVPSDVD